MKMKMKKNNNNQTRLIKIIFHTIWFIILLIFSYFVVWEKFMLTTDNNYNNNNTIQVETVASRFTWPLLRNIVVNVQQLAGLLWSLNKILVCFIIFILFYKFTNATSIIRTMFTNLNDTDDDEFVKNWFRVADR